MTEILGIKLSDLSLKEAEEKINLWLQEGKRGYAVTPNPEIILQSLKDDNLRQIINLAHFSFADGIGLKLVGFLKGKKIKRVTGSNLTCQLLKLAARKNYKVGIIIWEKGLSSLVEVENALKKKYPHLQFVVITTSCQEKLAFSVLTKLDNFSPDLLFIALGFPEQEKIASYYFDKIKNLKLTIGVGGTFDFITGKIKRAPYLLQFLGLEWLWRLILQPKRINRILRAVFLFPYKALIYYLYENRK